MFGNYTMTSTVRFERDSSLLLLISRDRKK